MSDEQPLAKTTRLEAEPYVPDNVCPPRGLVGLAFLVGVAGPLAGWLLHRASPILCNVFSSTAFAAIIWGPALIGFGVRVVRWGRVRRPFLTGAVGLALLLFLALGHLFSQFQAYLRQPGAQLNGAPQSFPDYLIDIHGWGLLWLLLPVALVGHRSYRQMAEAAARPYCPTQNDWKEPTAPLQVLGRGQSLQKMLAEGDLLRLATFRKIVVKLKDEPVELLTETAVPPPEGVELWQLVAYLPRERDPEGTVEVELSGAGGPLGVWSYPEPARRVIEELQTRPPLAQ